MPTHGIAVDGTGVRIFLAVAHVVVCSLGVCEHGVGIHAPGTKVAAAATACEREALIKVDEDRATARCLQLLSRSHNVGYLCLQLVEHCTDAKLFWVGFRHARLVELARLIVPAVSVTSTG